MPAPSTVPCVTVSASGCVVAEAEQLATLLGETAIAGRRLASFGDTPDDATGIDACLQQVVAQRVPATVHVRLRSHGAHGLSARLVVTPGPGDDLTVVVIDKTARAEAHDEVARSERRWLSLLRNSTDVIFTTAEDGSLTTVTTALPERLGWLTDDVIGRPGLQFVHPDDREVARRAWRDVRDGHARQVNLELRLLHVDRTTTWARVLITDLRDDPDVGSVIGNVTDITDRRTEETHRRHLESRFRAQFDQSHVPQVLQGQDGTYQAVNDALCALLGRSRDELVGARSTSFTHADDPGEAEDVMSALRNGKTESAQVDRLFTDADARPVPVRVDATLLRDVDGNPSGCVASYLDLRPLRDSEQARTDLQELFDAVATRSRDFITLHDTEGRTLYGSPAGFAMFGERYSKSSADLAELVHPDDAAGAQAQWEAVQSQPESRTFQYRARSITGRWIWIEQTSTNLLDTRIAAIVSIVRDVTAIVEAAAALRISEARYRAIAETAEEGILVAAPDGVVTYANARIASMLGLAADELLDAQVWSALTGLATTDFAARVRDRQQRESQRYEVPYRHPDGSLRTLWIAASPMPDVEGRPQGSLAMVTDITELRRNERDLRHAAEHDELTGLLNRSMLMEHLDHPDTPGVAVLFIDLDHFKDVNDGRGHTTGDDLLIAVATRLRSAVGDDDVVARFGGDEFVVVLHDVDQQSATTTARRLLDTLSATYLIGHHSLRIGATIGIALSPAASGEDLLRFADTAMYAAKASGRGGVRLFDQALAELAEERYSIGAELLTALANDGLDMSYQPVVDVSTGEVSGVEALARWHHPTRGTIPPSRFVALAELTASAADLDRWVIRRAMRDIAELKADWSMPEAATLAINLSGQSLVHGLDSYIVDSAREAGLEPAGVTLELTESAIMADKDVAISVLQRLRDRGFGIAIDDFGTGYSSMVYLRDLPITVLKIDRGFVRGIPDDAHSLAIVTSLIELARSLDLTVVAEGVETPAHLEALRARGCTLAQGWLWSPALTPAELRESGMFDRRFVTD